MRPAELRPSLVITQITAKAVTAQDAFKHRPQQAKQYRAAACGLDRVHNVLRRQEYPQKPFAAFGPPASFVGVDHRLVLQLLLQFLAWTGHRLTGFFPALLCAPQADFDS